ncbi:Hint domain-containing protein [Pararhodobacter oceanensis]|uniref:Hint domain-containing protein n=1 Tax=Pararhodobacter oceanensis TaxID=2172121 RepID=UPI003A8D8130
MTHAPPAPSAPPVAAHPVAVFAAVDLPVLTGANAGDALPDPAESVCGDYYRPGEGAKPLTLMLDLTHDHAAAGRVGAGSDLGRAGEAVQLLGTLSLMAPDGDLVEVLVLDLASAGRIALPLSPLMPRHVYTLIATDPSGGPIKLADTVAGALCHGTRIALADGRQLPIEELQIGDLVITRDHAVQPLRWKGNVRLRAEGSFAPVTVMPGVMGNPAPLSVSPYHRLFLYRRAAKSDAGAAELLVQARHLVDNTRILRRAGGYVEYFSLVFDAHEVIYAEGVPCESLLVCPAVLTRLPDDLAAPLRDAFPGLSQRLHTGADLRPEIISRLRDRPGVFNDLSS